MLRLSTELVKIYLKFFFSFGVCSEYAYTTALTEKGDVYSFGVVILETIMGRHPPEIISLVSSPSPSPSSSWRSVMLKDVLDSRLSAPDYGLRITKVSSSVVLVLTLALACLRSEPKSRPTMMMVCRQLLLPRIPVCQPLHSISIQQLVDQEIFVVDKQ